MWRLDHVGPRMYLVLGARCPELSSGTIQCCDMITLLPSFCVYWMNYTWAFTLQPLLPSSFPPATHHKTALASSKKYTIVNSTVVDTQSLLPWPKIPNLALARLGKVSREGGIIQLLLRNQISSMTVKCSSYCWHHGFSLTSMRYSWDFSLETYIRTLLYRSVPAKYSIAWDKTSSVRELWVLLNILNSCCDQYDKEDYREKRSLSYISNTQLSNQHNANV